MSLAACIWALTCPQEIALTQIADAGFTHIDIRPSGLQTPDLQRRAKDLGLAISCMAASAEMPAGASLVGDDPQPARDHVCRAVEHAALLGATTAYLVPQGDDPDCFAESLPLLADHAHHAGLKLAVEHFPGTFLPPCRPHSNTSKKSVTPTCTCFLTSATHKSPMKIPRR